MRAPLVEAEQHGPICIQDLTKVVMGRRRRGLAEERLVPFEAARNVAYADDRPCAFHRISAVGLTTRLSDRAGNSRSAATVASLFSRTVGLPQQDGVSLERLVRQDEPTHIVLVTCHDEEFFSINAFFISTSGPGPKFHIKQSKAHKLKTSH